MIKYLVVDASFAIRLVTPHPQRNFFIALSEEWLAQRFELYAPSLWLYEVTSAITKLVRFKELTEIQGREILLLLQKLDVQLFEMDEILIGKAFEWTVQLNRAAAYDCFYLALAERLRCEFWTADQRLVNAVNQPWVRLAAPEN